MLVQLSARPGEIGTKSTRCSKVVGDWVVVAAETFINALNCLNVQVLNRGRQMDENQPKTDYEIGQDNITALADRVGGIDKAKEALSMLEKLT